jgi:hypothetical protein
MHRLDANVLCFDESKFHAGQFDFYLHDRSLSLADEPPEILCADFRRAMKPQV